MAGKDDHLTWVLKGRAYDQGRHAGLNGLLTHDADWEPEFRAEYRRGQADGRAEREQSAGPAARSWR